MGGSDREKGGQALDFTLAKDAEGCTLRSKAGRRTQKRAQRGSEFSNSPPNSSLLIVLQCEPLPWILALWTMGQVAPGK